MLCTAATLLVLLCSRAVQTGDFTDYIFEELKKSINNTVVPLDYTLEIVDYVEKQGYPIESHEVTTEDGYILTLHRIPHGRVQDDAKETLKRPPVLLMHSLFCSSMDWVYLGPNKSIGFLLADAGYDVWMGNVRGNTWSRKHITLNPDTDKEFWNFSFHEHGHYDVPAKIDHILNVTGKNQLYYIGHSMGTTILFVMTSLKPEYNKKIKHGICLAPIAFITEVKSPVVKFFFRFEKPIENLLNIHEVTEVLPSSRLVKQMASTICADGSPYQDICPTIIFSLAGYDAPQLNRTHLPMIITHTPAGSSMKNLLHFYHLMSSGSFIHFDYGRDENILRYNATKPPKYNLLRVITPVTLYIAENDYLSSVKDALHLAEILPNSRVKKIKYKRFTHLDHMIAKDVDTLLNIELIGYIDSIRSGGNRSGSDYKSSVLFTSLIYVPSVLLVYNTIKI